MKTPVIIDAVRTPIGKAHPAKGLFRNVRGDDLAVEAVKAIVQRTGIDPTEIEDVLLGCSHQNGELGFNVARTVALMAGLPATTAGQTINRLCGSSLQALHSAVHSIAAGCEDVQVVGGVEHMHHLPMMAGADLNPKLFHRTSKAALQMGVTAEYLAQTHNISREAQDSFAFESHRKAAAAEMSRAFEDEIIPIAGRNETGERIFAKHDQSIRHEPSLESLSALRPIFLPRGGTITAGNSSPLNDGAAAMLVMSEAKAGELGLKPLAKVLATAVVGVEPCLMGTGPVPASEKVLKRAGMNWGDVDLVEINEAFAAQTLACVRLLDLDETKLNIHGGAISIGHPLGASGARIVTTLLHAMKTHDINIGLATMCIGMGQGIATIFERM